MKHNSNKYIGLELFRGLSAIWVMLFHFKEITPNTIYTYPYFDNLLSNGGYGVEFFFIISGFIMLERYRMDFEKTVFNRALYTYTIKRIARIFPLHVTTLFIMVIGAYTISFYSDKALDDSRYSLEAIFISIFLLSFYFPRFTDPNMPAWTLSAEFLAYTTIPFIAYFVTNKRIHFIIISFIFLLFIYINTDINHLKPYQRLVFGYFIGFYTHIFFNTAKNFKYNIKYFLILISFFLLFFIKNYLCMLIFFSLISITISIYNDIIIKNSFLYKIFTFFGMLSFPIYMLQWPSRTYFRSILSILNINLTNAQTIVLYILLTILTAYVMHIHIEQKYRTKIIKRFINF